jgi:hypothetical protein
MSLGSMDNELLRSGLHEARNTLNKKDDKTIFKVNVTLEIQS